MAVGVGITTYNRSELLRNILPIWLKRSPKNFIFCVNIDGESVEGYEWIEEYEDVYVIRDGKRKGIAASKNACMDYLYSKGCDKIFMADDDIYPKSDDWYNPFSKSEMLHSCFITQSFGGEKLLWVGAKDYSFSGCPGMLLYFRDSATQERYNEDFGIYGFEHVEITERLWRKNRGVSQPLTPSAYVAPKYLDGKFYSIDYDYGHLKQLPEFEFDENLISTSLLGEDVQSYVNYAAKVKQQIDKNR
jgi:glycosyltransferase involved in cell wall biosynthesis